MSDDIESERPEGVPDDVWERLKAQVVEQRARRRAGQAPYPLGTPLHRPSEPVPVAEALEDLQAVIARAMQSSSLEQERQRKEREQRAVLLRERAEAKRQAWWRSDVQSITDGLIVAEDVFQRLKATQALAAVKRWLLANDGRALCLSGPVGCGKSLAAAWAVKRWCEPRIEECWNPEHTERVPRVVRGERVSWLRPNDLVSAVLHEYDANAPRLHRYVVVDDLGRERRPDFQEALATLLEQRSRRIVFTTNLTHAEMRERYEPRVVERIDHQVQWSDVQGASLRRRGGF